GHGTPVLRSRGTYAGDRGERLGVGPVIDYSSEALREELEDLRARPERLAQFARAARRVRHDQTWRARAAQAGERLGARRPWAGSPPAGAVSAPHLLQRRLRRVMLPHPVA